MGFESCAYVATENVGVAFAHTARNVCLLIMFLGFLGGGILLVVTFPNEGCTPSALSDQAVGLGILLFIASCCACTQGICYVFDERSRVARTSTQAQGDVPSKKAPRGAEVYAAIDIGEKACSTLSSCWQMCVFLSCFGIGLSLLTMLPQNEIDSFVSGQESGIINGGHSPAPSSIDNGSNSSSSGTVNGTACPSGMLFIIGFITLVLPVLFCLTLVWRLCRSPSPLKHFEGTTYTENLIGRSISMDFGRPSRVGGQVNSGVGISNGNSAMVVNARSTSSSSAAPRDVELAVS